MPKGRLKAELWGHTEKNHDVRPSVRRNALYSFVLVETLQEDKRSRQVTLIKNHTSAIVIMEALTYKLSASGQLACGGT
jgi:hypothetical protein